ncbi:hypothetical protein M9H77_11013 [Catharanthus roseus]|uniref:Uncharacterized protein n=1 Tax=Catharanthus roseus TaxID=4058 RepID=A0ACC0BDB8_CATRO|nr:hypothetical protein M9H77_11013 [Catharanthus roseus]
MDSEDVYEMVVVAAEGCRTPEHDGCRIAAGSVCPPAPRKRRIYNMKQKKRNLPPKEGYFQAPNDLELIFGIMPRKSNYNYVPLQACLQG